MDAAKNPSRKLPKEIINDPSPIGSLLQKSNGIHIQTIGMIRRNVKYVLSRTAETIRTPIPIEKRIANRTNNNGLEQRMVDETVIPMKSEIELNNVSFLM